MQSSLWLALGGRLGHMHAFNEYGLSAIDEIMAQDRFTLEELIDSEEIIQEAKFGNAQLID